MEITLDWNSKKPSCSAQLAFNGSGRKKKMLLYPSNRSQERKNPQQIVLI